MLNVEEARKIFFEAKKALDDCMAKKAKLELRLAELKTKLSEISILDIKKERQKAVAAVALSAISDSEYRKAIEKLGKAGLEHAGLTEQIEAITEAMADTEDLLSKLQQGMNEASRCLYLAIAEKLTEELKLKMPLRDLQMLAVCKIRSGGIWGREGWNNMLNELTGGGRFDTSTHDVELKTQFNF